MKILRKVAEFTNSVEDKLVIYKTFIRNILEQSCEVWHSSLSLRNIKKLDRVQKCAVNLILQGNLHYNEKLKILKLPRLWNRREMLVKRFAIKNKDNKKHV